MEKAKDFTPDQETYANDIEMYLQLFCEYNNIQDMSKESQSLWGSAMIFIQRQAFRDRETFRNHNLISLSNNPIPSTYNTYDFDILNAVCDIYIYLCMRYDKSINISDFSLLTGIPHKTIYNWGYDNYNKRLSQGGKDLLEKLMYFNEVSLSNKLESGKSNPVGIIAVLNRKHGWASSPYTADAARQQRDVLTADQLPQLGQKKTESLPGTDKITADEPKAQDVVD